MFKKYDDLLTIMKNYESDIEEQKEQLITNPKMNY